MAKQVAIGGRTFSIARCSAIEALDLELSLAKAGGSWIAGLDVRELAGLFGSAGDAGRVALGVQLAQGLGEVAQKLTHAELVRLMSLVFGHCSCDGTTITDINSTFADRPRDIWLAFLEALKVNLGPLGEGLLSNSSAATQPKP